MSSGGGSTTTQSTELPSWLQNAAQSNLERADYVSKLGYVPQYGLDVAGFTPMQEAAMQNTANAASAFGLSAPTDAMAGMPAQQTNNLGFSGYSSGDLYNSYLGNLAQQAPAQYASMRGMFIDPMTGQLGVSFDETGTSINPNAVISAPEAGLGGGSGVGSGATMESTGTNYLTGGAGTGNIEGGNQLGYAGNPWVKTGMALKGIQDIPVLGTGMLGVLGGLIGEQMIGYGPVDSLSGEVLGTRGSFDSGEFSDGTATDISGGAIGSNVATNPAGDVVSLGYGYGQIDPRIAQAAGFTMDPSYNPTPAPQVKAFTDGSTAVSSVDPATGKSTVTYYDASGKSIGTYNSGGGLTLTEKNADGMYIVPTAAQANAQQVAINQAAAAQAAAQAAASQPVTPLYSSGGSGLTPSSSGGWTGSASTASRSSSALDSGTGSGIGSGGGNAAGGFSFGGW